MRSKQLKDNHILPSPLKRKIQVIHWQITNGCNLRCLHCLSDSGLKVADELTTDEALSLCDVIASLGCKKVSITGGEPLVRKDWPLICQRLVNHGLHVTVFTNGLLLTKSVVSQMQEIGIKGVGISLDGTKETHDVLRISSNLNLGSRYDSAIKAIDLLKDSSLKTAVVTTIHKHNSKQLDELFDILLLKKIDLWQVQSIIPFGRMLNLKDDYLLHPSKLSQLITNLAKLIKQDTLHVVVGDNIGYYTKEEPIIRRGLDKKANFWQGCHIGRGFLSILSNGDVKLCSILPQEFVVGNIRKTSVVDIWNNIDNCSFKTEFNYSLLEGGCAKCSYNKICKAGCAAMAYALTGTIYENPYCALRYASNKGENL